MKKIQFKGLKRFNWSGFFKYVFLILITSLLFVDILIALPLTEKVSSYVSYDLKTKDYWAKEYTLELDTTDLVNKESAISEVRSILLKRLNKYGVEKTTITHVEDGELDYVKVSVQSSKDVFFVDELVRSPFRVNVVTRKADVDFDNEEEPYAMYLGENYDNTEFWRDGFRNVYITKLKNSTGEYSYFALFKSWVWDSSWKNFLNDKKGEMIGVSTDGFVTPMQIPYEENPVFALPLSSTTHEESTLISILYNSGHMPVGYTLKDQVEKDVNIAEVDYVKITAGLLLAIVVIYLYLLFVDRTPDRTLIYGGLSTLITLASWITYLKLSGIPVDIFLLAIEIISVVAILRMTSENKESHMIINILVALVASLAVILGTGYVKIFGSDMLLILIFSNIAQIFSRFYMDKISNVFRA